MASTKKILLLSACFVLISAISGQDGVEEIPVNFNGSANLTCDLGNKNLTNYSWKKLGGPDNTERLNNLTRVQRIDEKRGRLMLENVRPEDAGTYQCTAREGGRNFTGKTIKIVVNGIPIISDCVATPLMVDRVDAKWKVNDGDDPVLKYNFDYQKSGEQKWTHIVEITANGSSSQLLNSTNFEKGGVYELRIKASNKRGLPIGNCTASFEALEEDFVPKPSINGSTNTSITIYWTTPAADLREYYQYEILQKPGYNKSESTHRDIISNSSIIQNLEPDTDYVLNVRACIVSTEYCGDWSAGQKGHTINNGPNISADLRPSGIINLFAAIIAFSFYFFF